MTRYILFFMLPILFFSCKEDEEGELWTEVHVNAIDYLTGDPIGDIIVGIYERKSKLINQGSEIETLKEDTLINGQFQFGWKAKRNSKYSYEFVAVSDFEKYDKIIFSQFEYLQKGGIYSYNFELAKSGYLNLDFSNINCQNDGDSLHFRYYLDHPYNEQYLFIYNPFWKDYSKNGCLLETMLNYQKLPAGTYTIEWNVHRDSGYIEGSDTFFVGNDDSVTYLLEY